MGKTDYTLPLPEKSLIARFKPAFIMLLKGQSVTVVSIPHLGNTSHLRSINSNTSFLSKLGIKNEKFVFVDKDKIVGGYESFASELLQNLSDDVNFKIFESQNPYLLNQEIIKKTLQITDNNPVVIAVNIDEKIFNFISEIENLFLLMQKSATKNYVSFLWATDTKIERKYKRIHPSSTFLVNRLLQKNFDKNETRYCLKRIYTLKGKKISKKILNEPLKFTGGLACTFHQLANNEDVFSSEYVNRSLGDIKKEVDLNKDLVTREGFIFLKNIKLSTTYFHSIKLENTPTAQEINILKLLQEKSGETVSRDEIAQSMWGKGWRQKYSDWAIDKAISRIRKNINDPGYHIITIKNLGYQLLNYEL